MIESAPPAAASPTVPAGGGAGAPTHPRPPGPSETNRNMRLGVLNGALYQGGEGFIDASTVIPVFLSRLTTSSTLIGAASALSDFGWLTPQFLVAPIVTRLPRQLVAYRHAATLRAISLGVLASLIWPLFSHPTALLVAFFACYGTYCLGGGYGALPFMEIVGRVVPRERLGAFWSSRLFWGGTLAAIAGLVVREVLRLENQRLAFGLLFGAAALVVSIGYLLFGMIREPEHPPGVSPGTPLDVLRDGARRARTDPVFRNLLIARSSAAAWLTLSPFMVLFAVNQLGGGGRAAGTFLVSRVAGFVLSNLWWPRISRRAGNRGIFRIASRVLIGVCLCATAIAVLSPWSLNLIPATAAVIALEALAFVGGAVQSGMWVAYGSLLIELAPAGRRPVFVAQMNTFVGLSMLLPAVGGLVTDLVNAPVVFALCAPLAWWGSRAAACLPVARGIEPEGMNEDSGCS